MTHVTGLSHISKSQSHNNIIQRRLQKVLEQIILHSIATTCWLYGKHIYFRVGQLQCAHRPQSVVYKIDQLVLRTLLSFLYYSIQKLSFVFIQRLKTKSLVKRGNLYCLAQKNLVEFLVQINILCLLHILLMHGLYILISSLP